jgi:hypothetical protein
MTLDPAMSTPGMICICIILIFLLSYFNIIPTISSFIPNKMQWTQPYYHAEVMDREDNFRGL